MKIAISSFLIFLYLTSLQNLLDQPQIDRWDIILICIQFLSSFLVIAHFVKPNKKKTLKRGRVRLQKHIDERKKLIHELRCNHQGKAKSKVVYGYPWWIWFR